MFLINGCNELRKNETFVYTYRGHKSRWSRMTVPRFLPIEDLFPLFFPLGSDLTLRMHNVVSFMETKTHECVRIGEVGGRTLIRSYRIERHPIFCLSQRESRSGDMGGTSSLSFFFFVPAPLDPLDDFGSWLPPVCTILFDIVGKGFLHGRKTEIEPDHFASGIHPMTEPISFVLLDFARDFPATNRWREGNEWEQFVARPSRDPVFYSVLSNELCSSR